MKQFLATCLVAMAAAKVELEAYDVVGDEEFHSTRAVVGQKHVDQVVDDPYSASGLFNVHGTEECEHAIGHDGTYEYLRLVPNADNKDESNSAGDYIESTVFLNGKPLYVNYEKERFFGWDTQEWSVASTSLLPTVIDGPAEPFPGFFFGRGQGAKPDAFDGWTMSYEMDMDMEPEWRCLMRPLLRQAVTYVEQAELSIESRALLEEKASLIEVHTRLVTEAEVRKNEASCIELIERAMARLEECELKVLRRYVEIADTYPTSWLQLLNEKRNCVDDFSKETATCNHLWTDQWDRYYG